MMPRILPKSKRPCTLLPGTCTLLIMLNTFTLSLAQTIPVMTVDVNESLHLDVESHSGTPPVLEFVLKGPEGTVRFLSFDFESDGTHDLLIDEIHGEVVFRGVPFRKPGLYHTTVYLYTGEGRFTREFNIAYTDFVWGRDNFRFANDGKFEDAGDFVSETLVEWAEDRFGPLSQEQQVLLLSVMYDIYKGSIGRCYGFTGEQIYYINNPERIPSPYGSIYWMGEKNRELFRNMDYVQNDIVFANFLSGKINVKEPQDREGLLRELDIIKRSIEQGESIIIGYLSNRMHHSMVVYGYFENLFRNKITLLTANNWEREQENNTYSEDAENIVIELHQNKPRLSWYDLTKKRYRYPKGIFAVRREEQYELPFENLENLLNSAAREIIESDRAVIMVEKTETAYMTDGEGNKRGYSKPKHYREIDEVTFKKIDYNFIFEYPAGEEYRLVLKKRRYNKERDEYKKVNLFAIVPRGDSLQTMVMKDVPVQDEIELVFLVSRDGVRPE